MRVIFLIIGFILLSSGVKAQILRQSKAQNGNVIIRNRDYISCNGKIELKLKQDKYYSFDSSIRHYELEMVDNEVREVYLYHLPSRDIPQIKIYIYNVGVKSNISFSSYFFDDSGLLQLKIYKKVSNSLISFGFNHPHMQRAYEFDVQIQPHEIDSLIQFGINPEVPITDTGLYFVCAEYIQKCKGFTTLTKTNNAYFRVVK